MLLDDALIARASAKNRKGKISLLLHLTSEHEMPGCPKLQVGEGGERESQKGAYGCRG